MTDPIIIDTGVPCGYRISVQDEPPRVAVDMSCKIQSTVNHVAPGAMGAYVGTYMCCGASYGSHRHPDLGLNGKKRSAAVPSRFRAVLKSEPQRCSRCGSGWQTPLGSDLHADHRVSRKRCELLKLPGCLIHHPYNLALMCAECNIEKSASGSPANPLWWGWVQTYMSDR